ncbi:peptidylprolyl isomerase [Flavobacteriaceae bacterium LMO-SS05]
MGLKRVICVTFLCISVLGFAQITDKDVLLTVDGEPVMASEFVRVYSKNLGLVQDESQKDIEAYLELFVNFKLKVKEAKRLGMDKEQKYLREFDNYKQQLTQNFLNETKVTDALVKEAYDRYKQEIKASHILIMMDENDQDTLEVYNRLLELRERLQNESFEKVQKEVHNGTNVFAEDLGYFSVFKMVYPFENVAFNTKVGEVSMPFRTRFGFHIVKVFDKRAARGEVTVEHIMVSHNQTDSTLVPETRIKEIYKKIEQGENFESLAKQFSDDKSSSSNGGLLPSITGGQLSSQNFEDVAFGLQGIGDISQPFKTAYGWHIVKLIHKEGIEPFEVIKAEIVSKVKRDSRSNLINSALVQTLKSKYNVVVHEEALPYFESILTEEFFKNGWKLPEYLVTNNPILTIDRTEYSYTDFGNYLMSTQRQYFGKNAPFKNILRKELETFVETNVMKYHEDHLEFENKEFANVLQEYRDGLLLFDLMEKQVWNAAVKDTLGLKNYYEGHKNKYYWPDRVDAIVVSGANQKDVSEAEKLLQNGTSVEKIKAELNSDKEQKVIITNGIMELDHHLLPRNLEFKEGISKIYEQNDAFHIVKVNKVIPKSNKTLEESKGNVINDFQNEIEKNWIQTLKEHFKVIINKDVKAKVKSQMHNN